MSIQYIGSQVTGEETMQVLRARIILLQDLIDKETLPSMKEFLQTEARQLRVRAAALYLLENANWKTLPKH